MAPSAGSDGAVEVDLSDAPPERKPGAPITIQLKEPIKLGSQTLEEITLRFSPRAFKDFEIPLKEDGTIIFRPYPLAVAGMRMAGQPDAAFNKLGALDFMEVARAAMTFLG